VIRASDWVSHDPCPPMLCSVVQCVAMCCNMLQCVAVCCSVLQCVATCCSVLQFVAVCCRADDVTEEHDPCERLGES